jgi:uncharacterized protein (DUF433 family)
MAADLLHDRGRGPEVVGTRITVYNLLVDFLDPTKTESYICKLYELTPEQVAAARAYILNNPDTVLARHLQIEERIAAGNPPEVVEQAKKTHAAFLSFKQWLVEREKAEALDKAAEASRPGNERFPSFREWFDQQQSSPTQGS